MDECTTWAAAALRVASEEMTIDEMTAALGLAPSDVALKGMPYSRRNPRSKLRTHNVWIRDSGLGSDAPFLDHIDVLLDDITPRREHLETLVGRCVLDLFTGYGTGDEAGLTILDHARVTRLAGLPVSLTVDLHPPTIDDGDGPVVLSPPERRAEGTNLEGGGPEDDTSRGVIDEQYPDLTGWRVVPAVRSNIGALAIRSTRLSGDEITSLLALRPTPQATDGSSARQIDAFSLLAHEAATWIRESGLPRSAPLEEHLATLMAAMEDRVSALERVAADASIEVHLCFASDWGQGGLTVEHSDLARLAALPVHLAIELAFPPRTVH